MTETPPNLQFQFIDALNNNRFSLQIGISTSSKLIQVTINAHNPNEKGLWNNSIEIRYVVGTFSGVLVFDEDPDNSSSSRNTYIGVPEQAFTCRRAQKIPKKLYQAWLQAEPDAHGELQVPSDMKTAIQSWKDLNPDYEYELFNEDKIKSFLTDNFPPIYLETYNLLLPRAYRVDFWRYCVLYKYGGVYSDSKMTLLRPLSQIVRPNDEFVVSNAGDEFVAIAFLAFTPKHPLLEHIIFNIINYVRERYKSDSPLALTGPHLFGRILKLHLGISGPISCGCTDTYQIMRFSSTKGYFYDTYNNTIIKYLYDSYKKNDNQEWNHYPSLWASDIVFADKVTNPLLREIPFLRDKPQWLIDAEVAATAPPMITTCQNTNNYY